MSESKRERERDIKKERNKERVERIWKEEKSVRVRGWNRESSLSLHTATFSSIMDILMLNQDIISSVAPS